MGIKRVLLIVVVLLFGHTLQADAGLSMRGSDNLGNRLIYDSDLDITWYDFTSKAASWQDQVNWADRLVVDFNGASLIDWRLPGTPNGGFSWGYDGTTTAGLNITDSEMGHLFYTELGNSGYLDTVGNSVVGYGLQNSGDFQNLKQAYYWSDYNSENYSWGFNLAEGHQNTRNVGLFSYGAIAVRDGDVGSISVAGGPVAPEPVSTTLFLIGGTALGARHFRKKKSS